MATEHPDPAYFSRYQAASPANFSGLSPAQMALLIYNSPDVRSPVRLQENVSEEVLDQVPFLLLTEAFLKIIQREGSLKLTALGALPRKYLLELYALRLLPEENIETGLLKLTREQDSVVLSALHINTTLTGLVKKVHGKLSLTKKAAQFLRAGQRSALLELVLFTFTEKFNWAYFDLYPSETVGQMAWAYSVYLLHIFGEEPRPADFYAEKYRQAFPFIRHDFIDQMYSTPEEQLVSCYCIRVFGRSLNWFGLVEAQQQQHYQNINTQLVAPTALLPQLFAISAPPTQPIL